MSLNYDITGIEDFMELQDEVEPDDWRIRPITQTIIFTTMAVGMGEITTANYEEFYARAQLFELLNKIPFAQRISYDNIHRHIGLRTNVSFESWAKWSRRLLDYRRKEEIRYGRLRSTVVS